MTEFPDDIDARDADAQRGADTRAFDAGGDASAMASGMGTGNDESTPGEELAEGPTSAEDRMLLSELETSGEGEVVDEEANPVEESAAMSRAVDDDAPLPGRPTPPGSDPDTPRFSSASS
ncbi:MAG: hypothetical protein JWN47_2311 [Frankiales bacterium]|nr:hypothetical protein [Frankiales bacterium]